MSEQNPNLAWLDKTRYEVLLQCERKFWWKHGRGFTSNAVSPELANGLAHHDAMDVFWRSVRWGGATPLDAVEPAVETWKSRWSSEPDGKKNAKTGELSLLREETSSYSSAVARAALTLYAGTFASRFGEYELVDIESSFRIELGACQVRGRWDKVLRGPDGRIWLGEHKTTRRIGKDGRIDFSWEQNWERDAGTTLYCLAGERHFGEAFGGVLVDGVLYMPKSHVLSVPQTRTQAALKQFEESFSQRFAMIQRGEFPMREASCFAFGRSCEYADLCNAGWELSEAPLPQGMEVRFWNPEKA